MQTFSVPVRRHVVTGTDPKRVPSLVATVTVRAESKQAAITEALDSVQHNNPVMVHVLNAEVVEEVS